MFIFKYLMCECGGVGRGEQMLWLLLSSERVGCVWVLVCVCVNGFCGYCQPVNGLFFFFGGGGVLNRSGGYCQPTKGLCVCVCVCV